MEVQRKVGGERQGRCHNPNNKTTPFFMFVFWECATNSNMETLTVNSYEISAWPSSDCFHYRPDAESLRDVPYYVLST